MRGPPHIETTLFGVEEGPPSCEMSIFKFLKIQCDTKDEKRGLKNGDNSELGDDGIIFRHCVSGWLVHIWLIGCSNIGDNCDGLNGHYQIYLDAWVRPWGKSVQAAISY